MPYKDPEKRKIHDQKPENRAKQKEYEVKRKEKPEYKAKRKAYEVKRRQKPDYKEKRKERESRPENKAKRKEWAIKNKKQIQQKRKIRESGLEWKERRNAYNKKRNQKPEVKAKRKAYVLNNVEKFRQNSLRYEANPVNKNKRKNYRDKIKMDIFSYFSKLHSDSDIPCCRCCKENFHIDFLNLDHIQGRKQMDSIEELTNLGYSSELQGKVLQIWINKNNCLSDLKKDYFQVLCFNCNMTKGMFGSCPHTRK